MDDYRDQMDVLMRWSIVLIHYCSLKGAWSGWVPGKCKPCVSSACFTEVFIQAEWLCYYFTSCTMSIITFLFWSFRLHSLRSLECSLSKYMNWTIMADCRTGALRLLFQKYKFIKTMRLVYRTSSMEVPCRGGSSKLWTVDSFEVCNI